MTLFLLILLISIFYPSVECVTPKLKRCLYWRGIMKVSCAYIYNNYETPEDTYAIVEWNLTNQRIFEDIDKQCTGCHFENELIMLIKGEKYEFRYINDKIVITGINNDKYYETEQNLHDCYLCFLNLYIVK